LKRSASLALLAGAPFALSRPARAQDAVIRIGTVPTETSAEAFYAKEMGFFAKAGLDADIHMIASASVVTTAVASNSVDVGWSSLVPLAIAHSKQIPFVVIAPASLYTSDTPNAAVFVALNSPIRSAKELNGKVFAVTGLGTISEFGPRAWIDGNGGDSSSVHFVELQYSAMPDALAAGRIDAAYFTEPWLAIAKKSGRLLGYPFGAVAKNFLFGSWFTMSQWAADHPDLVSRFASAIRETALWANANQAKSADILARYTKIDPAVVASMVRVRFGDRLSASMMQPEIDVAARYGKFSSFPAAELIYAPSR
jgi:NitT/TauT family transport system substrate-binding protein